MKLSNLVRGVFTVAISTGMMVACYGDDDVTLGSAADAGPDGGGAGGSGATGTGATSSTGATSNGGSSAGGAPVGPTCAQTAEITCDGAEDCPSGQRCCALWADEYVEFGCFDSCLALTADAAAGQALWLEMCHAGDACEDTDPAVQCLTSTYLPENLSRCYDTGSPPSADIGAVAGEINCGNDVCGAGEKCCLRTPMPLSPYCAPEASPCECDIPVPEAGAGGAGGSDGGPSSGGSGGAAPDAASGGASGTPDAGPSTDASADGSAGGPSCPDGSSCCAVPGDCAAGESCNTTTAQCETACGDADHTACNGGCCNGNSCVDGTAKNQCGSTGDACNSCSGASSCVAGTCQ